MAGEGDQTKWVGIRPTDPSENIPVTESSPLTVIQVEPKVGSADFPVDIKTHSCPTPVQPYLLTTEFKTLTQKRLPAIADMQAVETMVRTYVSEGKGATPHTWDAYTVPATKIFIVNFVYATYSGTTVTQIAANVRTDIGGMVNIPFVVWPHTAAWETHTWFGSLPVDEDEIIRFIWTGGAAGGTVIAALLGYLVPKYT